MDGTHGNPPVPTRSSSNLAQPYPTIMKTHFHPSKANPIHNPDKKNPFQPNPLAGLTKLFFLKHAEELCIIVPKNNINMVKYHS
jgi:hypothetical protein